MESKFIPLVLAMIMVFATIIVIVLAVSQKGRLQKLGENCSRYPCSRGLTCQSNKCKSNSGEFCNTLTDCTSDNLSCLNNKCTNVGGSIGNICTELLPCNPELICEKGICKSKLNGSCDNNSECIYPFICVEGTCREDIKVQTCDLLDIMTYGCIKLLLFSNKIKRINDNLGISMDITSSVEISRFFMYNGLLHSLGVDGKLYALSVPIEHNYWEWEEQLWCVNEIDHVSVTLDEHNIWIQRKYVHISGTRGYLYEGNSLISTHSLNVNVIRNYGITTLEYVEINKKTMVMYATPSGVILNNVSNARIGFDSKIVHSGGELIKVIFDRMVKVSIETYTTY